MGGFDRDLLVGEQTSENTCAQQLTHWLILAALVVAAKFSYSRNCAGKNTILVQLGVGAGFWGQVTASCRSQRLPSSYTQPRLGLPRSLTQRSVGAMCFEQGSLFFEVFNQETQPSLWAVGWSQAACRLNWVNMCTIEWGYFADRDEVQCTKLLKICSLVLLLLINFILLLLVILFLFLDLVLHFL